MPIDNSFRVEEKRASSGGTSWPVWVVYSNDAQTRQITWPLDDQEMANFIAEKLNEKYGQ